MIVYVIHHATPCGEFTHRFSSFMQAAYWLGVLAKNGIEPRMEYEFEKGPKQFEFPFC